MIPTREGSITVPGSRRIAFSVVGPEDGLPVIYLHGGIGTPIRCAPQLGEVVARLGIRHVALNRPGFGDSCGLRGRRLSDFPADLERVADHLGIDRFVLVGISSGGPYALAAARWIPERILSLGVVSCLSPLSPPHESRVMSPHLRLALRALVERPRLVERVAGGALALLRRHGDRAARLGRLFGDRGAVAAFAEATAGGIRGMLEDYALCCSPWGFELGEVQPEVHVWHGAGDRYVPLAHARALIAALPSTRVRIGSDDGHFFYRRRMAMVLEALAGAARARLLEESVAAAVAGLPVAHVTPGSAGGVAGEGLSRPLPIAA